MLRAGNSSGRGLGSRLTYEKVCGLMSTLDMASDFFPKYARMSQSIKYIFRLSMHMGVHCLPYVVCTLHSN